MYNYRAYGLGIHSELPLPELLSMADAPPDVSIRPESSPHPVPVRYIFFPSGRRKGNPKLRILDKEEAARKLLDNSANFHMFGGEGLRIIGKLADEAECYDLLSGELTETVRLISDVIK